MPEGLFTVVGLLALGYVLLFLEVFLPGGVLGVAGAVAVGYGCYLAFDLSAVWGAAAVGLSVVAAVVAVRVFARSRMADKLALDDAGARGWTAAEEGLDALVGQEGRTLGPLRPAGLIEIGDQRVDVVADAEFLEADVPVRVVQVEGNRVVVESILETEDSPAP